MSSLFITRKPQFAFPTGQAVSVFVFLLLSALLTFPAGTLRADANLTASQSVPALEYRTWTSDTGETMDAAFISLHQEQVMLKARDDRQISIPMHRLSWRDQIMARRLAGRPGTELTPAARRNAALTRQGFDGRIVAAFGPECEVLLTGAIKSAQREILVAIYTFTSTTVAEALQGAARRGVRIHIKYDHGQIDVGRMRNHIDMLRREQNVTVTPVEMSGRFASMHHKFAVIDQAFVFTGSFNFTVTAATQSYENAVLIQSDGIAGRYTLEFEAIESR